MAGAPIIRPIASHEEYEAALEVRRAVFVREQAGPPEEEPDAWDVSALHFVVLDDARVVGAARLYSPQSDVTKLGRICLLPEARGRGWGVLLMEELLHHAAAFSMNRIVLDAQTYAVGFYERFGFIAVGEEFLDAGTPHLRMELERPVDYSSDDYTSSRV
jgi:predicted GNAT family N-acyltransferase